MARCQQTDVGCYKGNTEHRSVDDPSKGECTACGVGKYTDAVTAGDALTTAGHTDPAVCKDCPAGTSSDQERNFMAGACPPCRMGKYQAATGQSQCTDCPAGKSTPAVGAQAESECVAAAAPTTTPPTTTPPPCVPSYTIECTLGFVGGLCPGGENCSVPCGWPGECAGPQLTNDACCAAPGDAACESGQCAPGYMCGWWSMGGVSGSGPHKTSTGWEAKCFKCPLNTYKEEAANLRCTDCPAGYTGPAGGPCSEQCLGIVNLSCIAATAIAVAFVVVGIAAYCCVKRFWPSEIGNPQHVAMSGAAVTGNLGTAAAVSASGSETGIIAAWGALETVNPGIAAEPDEPTEPPIEEKEGTAAV